VLAVQANRLSNEITTKQKEINSVNSQIEAIDKTRKELVQLGTADMLILQESIQSLNNFWSYTAGDARKIQNKLVNMKGDFVSTLL
jgi:predicted  nucleic acid-binding Zn-ribbon protein